MSTRNTLNANDHTSIGGVRMGSLGISRRMCIAMLVGFPIWEVPVEDAQDAVLWFG